MHGFDNPLYGKVYEERQYASTGTLMARKLTEWTVDGTVETSSPNYAAYKTRNPRVVREISIAFEPNETNALASMSEIEYDTHTDAEYFANLNPKRQEGYHYVVVNASTASTATLASATGWFSGATPAAVSETDYLYDANYKARYINGLVSETRVEDASGNTTAKTQITYDGLSLLNESISSNWVNPNTSYRGLVTKTRSWHDIAGNQYIDTQAQFDLMGNLRYATDGRGNVSETQYSSTYDYAFPTLVKTPIPDSTGVNGSNSALQSSTVYDYNTGLPTSTTDANGQTSTIEYNDALLRPTKVTAPNGHQTITEYGAGTSAATRWIKSRSQIDASTWKEGYSWFDGLGRTVRSQSVDDDGDVFSLTCYDNMGRVSKVTNPFRNWTNQNCSTTTGLEWTTNTFDSAGRPWKVTTPDNAVVETTYGLSVSGTIGTIKTATDQAGKKRKGITNTLGQMVRVIEDPDTLAFTTDYTFDTLGNLRKTAQGDQNRYFMHDSLGRLLYARQVEQDTNSNFSGSGYTDPVTGNNQWSVKYVYDANSNITSTTDARNISASATYDRLNRITLRDYSDSTPDVTFYYDGTGTGGVPDYAKGKTTKVTSSVSETIYTNFDNVGRLLSHQQITDGQTYDTSYDYNLSGALITQTYPSGRVVKNTTDSDGQLSQVQSKKNSGSGFFTYADSFSYNAAGAVTKMQLGNGRWETASYNSRLQVAQIGLGVTDSVQNLLKLESSYTTPSTTNNNGSLREQKITVPTVGSNSGFTATQAYAYDDLNRLNSATESVLATQTWKQEFSYDRYGNKNFVTGSGHTTTLGSCSTAVCNPTFPTDSANRNRFLSGQGYSNDANGNVTQDATSQRFNYDAENHQKEFFTSSNGGSTPDATYHYDGDGRRVKKVSSTEITIFVYDGIGKLVAEYSTAFASIQQVSYLTTDHLETPRIITNENGAVTSRKDSTAFGGEALSAQRVSGTTGNGYNPSSIRQDYTGYEKDAESGLEFAQARQYNSMHGRFTSVDPLNESGITGNPQTFNRYAYVSNDPLNAVDPSGMTMCSAEYSFEQCGGMAGIRSGNFGDEIANHNQHFGGMSQDAIDALGLHYERMSNSQAGKGFVTHAQAAAAEAAAVAMFQIFYGDYDESDPQSADPQFYSGAVNVNTPAPLRWDQKGIIGDFGDWATRAANNLTFGGVDYVNRNLHGMDDAEIARQMNSAAGQGGDNVGTILGIMLPGPGKAKHIFRPSVGHVNPTTAASQGRYLNLFQNVASNPANLHSSTTRGVSIFTQNFRNGKQVWVKTYGGRITNAGVNLPGRHK